ncbi:MAG TPA: S41 family peptidase [Candidatus Alistipes faecigallinarum]|nr:S41 family peptidase [Candidatus Alistipes faecigallinarum]
MTRSNRKYRIWGIAAAVLLVAGTAIFARRNDFGLGRTMEITVNMMRELALGYVDPIDADRLLEGAAAGMVSDLDPYTEFFSEEGMSDFEILTTGKYGGVGALIRQKDDWVRIAQPYEGSPADRGGLKIGDRILAIDGEPTRGYTTEQVSTLLKGEPGSRVKVTVEHLDSTRQTVTLRRERISIPGVPYAGWVADGIGYIRHSDFTEGCYEQMRAAIERLRGEGELRGLILDYRSNGGGILQEAVKILSMFVPKGTVVLTTRGRTEQKEYRTESEPILPDLPLAVLVNGNTASSSEIVAGALQDLDRAVLIGQRSFGKGLVQTTRPLGYNTMLKLTTAKYYIPSGRCIQAVDYSHSQQGDVRTVPDSLISEFTTRAGRKVYDGGGIMPDLCTEPEYISRFAVTLYALGFIEDFGDDYTRRHPGQQIDLRTFSITDADYADFKAFMKDKQVPYESDTRRALKVLTKAAADDRFEELRAQFERVEQELRDDTQTNLDTYREQIVDAINSDIVLRHGYQAGVIEHSLGGDGDVAEAVRVLENPGEYRRITAEQDTRKR